MQVKFSDNVNDFGYTFCKLPALRGVFALDGNAPKYFSEDELKEYFASNFNKGQRTFEVLFDKFSTEEIDSEWESEKSKVHEFFRGISGSKRFKKDLKEMLDNDF